MEQNEILNKKKNEIEKENLEIESIIIPNYKKKTKDTERKISKTIGTFDELVKETEKHRKLWHQEVDKIINKLNSLIKSKRENYITLLESHQSRLKNLISDMIQTMERNKNILNTNRVSEVTNYKSKLKQYRNIPADIDVKVPSLNTKIVEGREIGIEFGEYRATLTQTASFTATNKVSYENMKESLDKAMVISTISTGVLPLWRVACVGTDEVWVSGDDEVIKRVDIHGSLQESVTTACRTFPADICVTREGELIYSDSTTENVHIFRHGKPEVMITTPRGWRPYRLYCTSSGDILVNVSNYTQNKIIRYQGTILKMEMDKDEHGNPIFKEGYDILAVAENINGDISVCDGNADILVVVDKAGRVRFRYDGSQAMREKTSGPRYILTDTAGQIIMTDINNACIHILDKNGQLLKCVDNCGLDKPYGLSLSSGGTLWIGLPDSGKVKVIEYMK
ncbi:uncharacterized protein LOC133203695 [Saccostrea echinata]|uniref:uncharacterized protein LOC133203695 n=1 Tax=Saccostrea echinata TaxID=191078 RepID=UPI002A84181E|nr:uncharacterized protein LOC133203695 [Saccostrea echinata]